MIYRYIISMKKKKLLLVSHTAKPHEIILRNKLSRSSVWCCFCCYDNCANDLAKNKKIREFACLKMKNIQKCVG